MKSGRGLKFLHRIRVEGLTKGKSTKKEIKFKIQKNVYTGNLGMNYTVPGSC